MGGVFFVYALMGLGLGTVMGAGAYLVANDGQWQFLPALFWAGASLANGSDRACLLSGTVGHENPVALPGAVWSYTCYTWSSAWWMSRRFSAGCAAFQLGGDHVGAAGLCGLDGAGSGGLCGLQCPAGTGRFAWIDGWLSQRRTRGIAGAIFMIKILSVQLLNPALHPRHRQVQRADPSRRGNCRSRTNMGPTYGGVGRGRSPPNAVQTWLAAGLAAGGLGQAGQARPRSLCGGRLSSDL